MDDSIFGRRFRLVSRNFASGNETRVSRFAQIDQGGIATAVPSMSSYGGGIIDAFSFDTLPDDGEMRSDAE